MTTPKSTLYRVPQSLDAPVRWLGLPRDEAIAAALVGGIFLLLGKLLWALVLSAALIIAMKTLKRGQGSAWLVNVAYWYLPAVVMQVVLSHTPPSHQRDYLA